MDNAVLPLALLLTFAIFLISVASLRAWRQWLDVKRLEIAGRGRAGPRGELGDLRRRVRQLEAQANGIEI
jgi:hypothetical protein